MRAYCVPGDTIQEGALFFQLPLPEGTLFERGHNSRGGVVGLYLMPDTVRCLMDSSLEFLYKKGSNIGVTIRYFQ